MKINLGIT